mmetsp:Transcript_23489/g.26747  ORF Transcript_23489/g.26747 Transcript_23489/m.26747 type:complete len:390 (-) Transcript_23489:258-1427(-)
MMATSERHEADKDSERSEFDNILRNSSDMVDSRRRSYSIQENENREKNHSKNVQNVDMINLPFQYLPRHVSQQIHLLLAAQQPHNLIPLHLQANAIAASLNGTPGHQPALILSTALIPKFLEAQRAASATRQVGSNLSIVSLPIVSQPAFTVQDRLMVPPVYNGVNPNYPGLHLLHANPPVFAVENFLSPAECQFLIHSAVDCFGPAPVVGKGAGEISPSRTSSTCYLAREDLPDYMRKVSMLTGKPITDCELPQVGRYFPTQQYLQHFDAFDLSNEDGRRFASNGGQRTVTVLSYLNDVEQGGATLFPALNLQVQPRQGMAIIFFPATVDGLLDKLALHAAMPAVDTKFVSQVWIRQGVYRGQPSKRLSYTMGVPFSHPASMTGYAGF